jgi:hypothetical protein
VSSPSPAFTPTTHGTEAEPEHSDTARFISNFSRSESECLSEWPLSSLPTRLTLNHRVPGSSPGAPITQSLG